METTTISNNKRIAKNTIMLYTRMLLIMAVTLYTSRVVLEVLGVEDFGIYNIIAGVIVLFSFLNAAMTTATQRYLSIAIGKNDGVLSQKVFSTSLLSHLFLIGIVLILSESIGLWFVNTHLAIPFERKDVAIIIYHIAIITTCFNIIRVPFNASIIANERMSFYAYGTLVESGLKLLIVWLLLVFTYDKLKLYSIMICLVTCIIFFWYIWYCRKHFPLYRFNCKIDKNLIKEMSSFSGWNMFGGIADIGFSQGTNMILNIFHGVTLNAALGLANQVKTAIWSFVANLQIAANPQIVKSYAEGDMRHFTELIYSTSKYSYFLLLLISIPFLCNLDYVLYLWLVDVPAHTPTFLALTIILGLSETLHGPLWTGMQANGDLKQYQIVMSALLLLNLPFIYLVLYCSYPPEAVIVVQIILKVIVLIARLIYAKKRCNISLRVYTQMVIFPILLVTIVTVPIIYILAYRMEEGLFKLLCIGMLSIIITTTAIYFCGINTKERQIVKDIVGKYLHRHNIK